MLNVPLDEFSDGVDDDSRFSRIVDGVRLLPRLGQGFESDSHPEPVLPHREEVAKELRRLATLASSFGADWWARHALY